MNTFWLLLWEFFKTGLFAVGGGLATIPFLQKMSETYGWFTAETLSTIIAVSESTPGPMGINMATYIGFQMYGILGGIMTTLALVTPSIIIICIIANMLKKFKENKLIQGAFLGIRPSVVAFIIVACLDIFIITLFNSNAKDIFTVFNIPSIILLLSLFVINHFRKLHPISIIVVCAVVGIIFPL